MRQLVKYVREHLAADFKPAYYLTVFGFIAACICINYLTAPTGYRSWEGYLIANYSSRRSAYTLPLYFLFYSFPYLSLAAITAWFNRETTFWRSRDFWQRAIFMLVLISIQASFALYRQLDGTYTNPPDQYYLIKIVATLTPFVMIGIPVFLFWRFRDRSRGIGFMYGLTRRGFRPWPYLLLLGLMFPLVLWAASQPQFLSYYPTLRLSRLDGLTLIQHKWLAFGCYELAYGSYFVWAEVIFRGFFGVGMYNSMGRHATIPMSGLYAFRHFNKPIGETISSVFGGYILGAIALRSGNIFGGAIIHGGIAIMMDILAFWFKTRS